MEKYLQSYHEALELNSSNYEKWRKHKQDLDETRGNLNKYIKERNHDIMVPMGKKAFIRGKLQHTNEVTVCHGASIFSEQSVFQAIDLIATRMKMCNEQMQSLEKERELFSNNLNLSEDVFSAESQEIIEEYDEKSEIEWRRKHSDSVKRQKRKEAEDRKNKTKEVDINRMLEDYELMEELASELESLEVTDDDTLARLLNGEMRVPEAKMRIAHPTTFESYKDPPKISENNSSNDDTTASNDLIAQNNQEIVDLLKNYRCKIKELLRSLRKDDDRNLNLLLDLTELKEDIEDDIRKMNDDEDEEDSETTDRDSDDETTASITSVEPDEKKRKVRFSISLEDVKVIESKSDLYEDNSPSDESTIQIHFRHTPKKLSSYETDNEDTIVHPGDIYKRFQQQSSSTTLVKKSILKNKTPEKVPQPIPENPVKKIYQSDVIIGDVCEHKQQHLDEEVIQVASKQGNQKKVSKFKQMRAKS